MVFLTAITGLLTYGADEFSGPLSSWLIDSPDWLASVVKHGHSWLSHLMILLIIVHVLGVVIASRQHHENLIRSMVTGLKNPA